MKTVGIALKMKQILLVTNIMVVLMVGGCTVSPSVLGDNNIVGVGGGGVQEDQNSATIAPINSQAQSPMNMSKSAGAPDATGSIVPPGDEAAIVDLPDSSARMQSSSSIQAEESQSGGDAPAYTDEQAASADERHRRELINRGDLQEGQPLPVE